MAARAPRIVFVAMAVFLAGIGAAGLVQGNPEQATLTPSDFRIGDRAIYRVDIEGFDGETLFDEMRVQWEAPERIKDTAGHVVWGRPLRIERAGFDESSGQPYLYTQRTHVATDGQMLRTMWDGPAPGQSVAIEHFEAAQTSRSYRVAVYGPTNHAVPCGLTGPAAPAAAGDAIVLEGHCGLESRSLECSACTDATFRWAGPEPMAGGQAWRYIAQHDERVEAWFMPGIPFPVRIVVPIQHFIPQWTGSVRVHFVMTAQEQGGALYDERALDASRDERTAPRQPWGLDETGVQHPFPMSQAYALALAQTGDDSLQAYLDAHPDAYMAITWYNGYVATEEDWHHAWWFLVTDGDSYVAKNVVRRASTGAVNLPDPARATVEVQNVRWNEYPDHVRGVLPRPGIVPDHAPTVAAVHAAYRELRSDHLAGLAPTRWSMNVKCADSDCTSALIIAMGGYYETRRDVSAGLSPVPLHPGLLLDAPTYKEGRVGMLDSGHVSHYMEEVEHGELAPTRSAVRAEGDVEPYVEPRGAPSSWSMPSTSAGAAAGLAAVAVAALYAAWPWIKAGGVALFSRIERHQVLDHPLRRAIFDAVQAEPGLHFQQIVRRIGAGRSATKHHLEKLVETGLLCCAAGNGYTCYFLPGAVERAAMAAWPFAKADGARRILDALRDGPDSCRALARRTGMAPSTVSTHLRRMVEHDLVMRAGDDFHLAAQGRYVVGS